MAACRRIVFSLAGWAWGASVLAGTVERSAGAAGDPTPPRLAKGPFLTGLSEGGVDVRVEVDPPAALRVEVQSTRGGPSRAVVDASVAAFHVLHMTGLTAATAYRYVVRAAEKPIGSGRFATVPALDSGAPLTFLVYGDDRSDPTAHAAVTRALMGTPSDFLVNTGDLVEDGGRPQDWQTFFDIESALLRDRALFVAIGNHELYDDRAGANFARYFGFPDGAGGARPYGTARLGNVRLFFLNSMHEWGSGDEREWLERELTRADAEPGLVWRFAVVHHGAWSSGPHGDNGPFDGAHVPELLVRHHVDLLLAGHDHLYERGEDLGLKYVISGGGGAPLYPIGRRVQGARKDESAYHFIEVSTSARAMSLVARRVDGSVIDRCGIPAGGDWDCDAAPAPRPPASTSPPATASPPASSPPTTALASKAACAVGRSAGSSPDAPESARARLDALLLSAAVALAAVVRRLRRSAARGLYRGPLALIAPRAPR